MRPFAALVLAAACGSAKPAHVDLPAPLPSAQQGSNEGAPLDEIACTPQPMSTIEIADLDAALAQSRDFAQRCCTGDESGDVTVRVTPSPSGYQTALALTPDRLASSAGGVCVHAVFHRLLVKPYDAPERTSSVVVRLR
jgi:hypothetical protein